MYIKKVISNLLMEYLIFVNFFENFKIIIITNQAGIAKSYYTVDDFKLITD